MWKESFFLRIHISLEDHMLYYELLISKLYFPSRYSAKACIDKYVKLASSIFSTTWWHFVSNSLACVRMQRSWSFYLFISAKTNSSTCARKKQTFFLLSLPEMTIPSVTKGLWWCSAGWQLICPLSSWPFASWTHPRNMSKVCCICYPPPGPKYRTGCAHDCLPAKTHNKNGWESELY